MKKTIVLTAGVIDLSFTISADDHTNYINELMPDNKVAPAHNLLMRTICKDQKEELNAFLKEHPGADIQLAAALKMEFSPMVAIKVKK